MMNNKPLLHIHTICYNEEILLPFMINWYRERFPNCNITIYDNYSTDNTEKIALENNCNVVKHDSGDEIRDDLYLQVKNNCWKDSETDWNLLIDCDEILDITQEDLIREESLGSTIISFEGWNMITLSEDPAIIDLDLHWGSRAPQYDKSYLFNKKFISDINFSAGCHYCSPVGEIKYSDQKYKMYHFKAIGLDYMVNRHLEFGTRMSQQNIRNGWGVHYFDSEETIRKNWIFYQTHPELVKIR